MRIMQSSQDIPLSRIARQYDDVAYIVIFTESCKWVRVDADYVPYVVVSANDCIADVVNSHGESLLTDNDKIHAWHDITMYLSDNSNEFTMPYADAIVLSLDDIDCNVDF
jgi:hypothetical protein